MLQYLIDIFVGIAYSLGWRPKRRDFMQKQEVPLPAKEEPVLYRKVAPPVNDETGDNWGGGTYKF